MNSREFLEALKKKSRTEADDILYYCRFFASVSRELVLKEKLDPYTQCQWLLQGLPEAVLANIFYRYNIDLEDNDGINFDDLLEKSLVLVGCRKRLAEFIKKKKSDWKFTSHPEDQPTAEVNHHSITPVVLPPTSTVPSTIEPFTYKIPELAPTIRVIQGSVQVPVVRVDTSRVKEASELSSSDNACILVSDPTKDFYRDLGALFREPVDEEVVLLHVDSIDTVKPFEHTIVSGKITYRPDTNIRGTSFSKLLGTDTGVMKKFAIGVEDGRFPGVDDLVVESYDQRAVKAEDHG